MNPLALFLLLGMFLLALPETGQAAGTDTFAYKPGAVLYSQPAPGSAFVFRLLSERTVPAKVGGALSLRLPIAGPPLRCPPAGPLAGKCPSAFPTDCADGWCCPANASCCGNGICCASDKPYYCRSNNMCYATVDDAQAACGNDYSGCGRPAE